MSVLTTIIVLTSLGRRQNRGVGPVTSAEQVWTATRNAVKAEGWKGTIDTTFMSPMKRMTYLAGTTAYALVNLVYGIALIAIVVFFYFQLAHASAPRPPRSSPPPTSRSAAWESSSR